MQTKLLKYQDCKDWDRFVVNHSAATFYHLSGWKHVIEKSFGHRTFYLMAKEKGRIQGVLPLVHLKSWLFGSIFCSMPYLNFGGLCANTVEAEKQLIEKSRQILEKCNGDYLELRHASKSNHHLPFKTHKVSMTLELDPDPEKLWSNFKSKHRTNIRRAEKHGLVIRSGRMDLLADFYKIISIGWRDLGTPLYSYRFFEHIVEEFNDQIEIFIVYKDHRPIATAFNGRYKETVEGMWTYALREHIKLQTNNFLYWKMIEKACQDGFKRYHLGRSTSNSGATDFKKKWNAEPNQLFWEYILHRRKEMPDLSVDNPKFRFARETWQKLPVSLVNFLGPFISRSIP